MRKREEIEEDLHNARRRSVDDLLLEVLLDIRALLTGFYFLPDESREKEVKSQHKERKKNAN